jgi:multimeric flavodoxin WrbA
LILKENIAMRVLGISGGMRMGNSEILVKEALMGAEEHGAAVEIIRLMEMNIKPPMGEDMPGVSGDQAPVLKRKMSQCEGIILGAPAYCLTAPGYLLNIRDRVSIRHSVPAKPKIGALISVGWWHRSQIEQNAVLKLSHSGV